MQDDDPYKGLSSEEHAEWKHQETLRLYRSPGYKREWAAKDLCDWEEILRARKSISNFWTKEMRKSAERVEEKIRCLRSVM